MDFFSPGFSEQLDDSGAGSSPDDGVVHEDHSFSPDGVCYHVEFDANLVLTRFLTRCNKGSADVFVFDESDAIWNARLSGVTDLSLIHI